VLPLLLDAPRARKRGPATVVQCLRGRLAKMVASFIGEEIQTGDWA